MSIICKSHEFSDTSRIISHTNLSKICYLGKRVCICIMYVIYKIYPNLTYHFEI